MDDMTDHIIRQSMKNWATKTQPSTVGRARLLLLASSHNAQHDASHLSRKDRDGHFVPLFSSHTPIERLAEPFNQHRLWWALQISPIPLRNLA